MSAVVFVHINVYPVVVPQVFPEALYPAVRPHLLHRDQSSSSSSPSEPVCLINLPLQIVGV